MDSTPSEIGARVRYWRERRKLPRKQFADMVGRSTSWLDKIESGERELVRLPMIERVAEVLGVDPAVLTDLVRVTVLFGEGGFAPHPPRTGGQVMDSYPWQVALDAVKRE